MTFHCQPPFLSFHISSQCFFFLSFSIPALIFLLVCWQRPGWSNCGFWRSPCVWSRHGRCQGGHVRSSLALCGAGCGAWMDGWMDGHGAAGMHSDLFLLMAYSCFALPQPVWTYTNNCCVFCRVCFPQYWSTCLTENAFPSSCFLIQTLNTLIALFFVLSTSL